jgi:hypothetical protein
MVRIPVITLDQSGISVVVLLEEGDDITKAVVELLNNRELYVGDSIVITEEVEDTDEH